MRIAARASGAETPAVFARTVQLGSIRTAAVQTAQIAPPASFKVQLDHFHAVTVMSAGTLTKKEALRVTSALLQETMGRVTTQLVVLPSVHSAQRSITGTDKIACHVITTVWIAVKQGSPWILCLFARSITVSPKTLKKCTNVGITSTPKTVFRTILGTLQTQTAAKGGVSVLTTQQQHMVTPLALQLRRALSAPCASRAIIWTLTLRSASHAPASHSQAPRSY